MDSWTFPEGLIKQIPALHYMLVLDNNTSIVRLEVGPQTYCCKDQETAVYGPAKMIVIPPGHYTVVQNPVLRKNGQPVLDESGQVSLRWGEEEIRLEQDPFPLFAGEICEAVKPLEILEQNNALRIQAVRDFDDKYMKTETGAPVHRKAGSEWWVVGPATYIPQVESRIVCKQKPIVVQQGKAVRLRARKNLIDANGQERVTGEEWLYCNPGAYLPGIDEVVVTETVNPVILTAKDALHLTALREFKDRFGKIHKAGDEWLVTSEQSESYLIHVEERQIAKIQINSLTKREYMIITNPVGKNGVPQYGAQEIRRGETTFFLQPGEIAGEKREVEVLAANEALVVQSLKSHEKPERHQAGERWLITGPKEYWPELHIKIERRMAAPFQLGTFCVWRQDVLLLFFVGFFFFLIFLLYLLKRLFF